MQHMEHTPVFRIGERSTMCDCLWSLIQVEHEQYQVDGALDGGRTGIRCCVSPCSYYYFFRCILCFVRSCCRRLTRFGRCTVCRLARIFGGCRGGGGSHVGTRFAGGGGGGGGARQQEIFFCSPLIRQFNYMNNFHYCDTRCDN
eukprot:GEMP01093570.1.p1 GENE.GEMP01093570.1~~GEMP01093570.1.p1  ORF type:complete len:144 (-),score=9.21 GEMP01093570.1:119-550(-)